MTDRTVSVRLLANVAGYYAGIKTADKATRDFADSLEKTAAKRDALNRLGNIAGGVGLAAAAGLGFAVKASADFDQAMSGVAAATHESANTMDRLREAALQAGADTAFSATEAADGITQLSKAGVKSGDILAGGLRGALSLAAAGEVEVGEAAEIAATAMNQFGLSGKDVPHIADLLAAAAGKAQGEVSDVAQALKYVGPVAHQMGVSIEETVGVIGELASKGILADQAGTSLRGMLTSLTSPSKMAAEEMKSLGINLYDAQGQFVGFGGVAQQLKSHMEKLSEADRNEALGRIFGNEQITAARILYAGGAQDVQKWTNAVNDQGYASETAATKMDNLMGDLEKLSGSLQTALIGVGSGATQGPLRSLVQDLEGMVNVFNKLPQPVQQSAFAIGAMIAALGGGAFVATRFVGSIAETRAAMTALGVTAGQTRAMLAKVAIRGGAAALGGMVLAFNDLDQSSDRATRSLGQFVNVGGAALLGFGVGGPIGAAIGGSVGLIAAMVGALNDGSDAAERAAQSAQDYASTLDQETGAITANTKEHIRNRLEKEGVLKIAEQLGINTGLLVDGLAGEGGAAAATAAKFAELRAQYTGIQGPARSYQQAMDDGGVSTQTLVGILNGHRAAQQEQLPALRQVTDAYNTESKGIDQAQESIRRKARADSDGTLAAQGATGAINGQAKAVKDLADSFEDLNAKLEARGAARDYEASLDAVDDRLQEHRDAASAVADGEQALADARSSAADQIEGAEDALADAQDQARQAQEDLNAARKEGAERLRDMRLELEGAALSEEGALLSIRSARERLSEVQADPKSSDLDRDEAAFALKEAKQRLKEVRESNTDLRQEYKNQSKNGVDSTDEVVDAKGRLKDANAGVQDAEENLADAMAAGADSIAAAAKQLRGLRQDLRLLAYGFNTNKEAGRSNQEILDGIATSALKVAEGMDDAKKQSAFLKQARGDFVQAATALGMDAKKARNLADELLRLPKQVNTGVNLSTAEAERKLKRLRDHAENEPIRLAAKVALLPGDRTAPGLQPGLSYTNETHAGGGWVSGPLGVAGRGEFVVNRDDARANRAVLEAINSGRRWSDAPRQMPTVSRTTSHHRDGDTHNWIVHGPSFAEIERQGAKKRRHTNSGGKTFS